MNTNTLNKRLWRILSAMLVIAMILTSVSIPAFADTAGDDATGITVYMTVSDKGEIVTDKSSNAVALAPVELNGKETYTIDDAFKALHDTYYDGGSAAGYGSATGEWGPYVTTLWGDTSGNFGYQVNGGKESVMGLSHEVDDGDYIDAVIYENAYPNTESYTKFDNYSLETFKDVSTELTLSQAGYDENWNMIFSACENAEITINGEKTEYVTDKDGKIILSFKDAGKYIISAKKNKTVDGKETAAICAPVCIINVKELPDACITIPNDATLFVGKKGKVHFVRFTEVKPVLSKMGKENTEYYFELDNKSTYNYRISGAEYITYGGTFSKTEDFRMTVSPEQLKPNNKTKTTVDREASSNNGYNVADIYLNINPQGYLKLSKGENFQIVSLRNWEAVNNTIDNYFIEPDFHYEVIDENGKAESDVVKVDKDGLLTAQNSGTAIVLVTYDAMTLNYGKGEDFYGAIYPENTGVFVVSVDSDESEIETGITLNEGKNSSKIKLSGDNLDAEHDCIYYVGDQGEYTFTPVTNGIKVFAASPTVGEKTEYNGFTEIAPNEDKSYSVPLSEGRNIVKLEKDGKTEYQIITAKRVNVTVNSGEEVHRGDKVQVVFDKLYHPANKLAGVYNMNAVAVYTDVSGYDKKIIGATSEQYNFANKESAHTVANILKEKNVWGSVSYVKDTDLIVPTDYEYDTFTLSGGAIYVSGWGDPYGNHRGITYETGKGVNTNAESKLGYLAKLPDIKIPVIATSSALEEITVNTENAKTEYFAGDKVDKSSLVVTAKYEDGTTQIATNYSVSPEILEADTQKITVTYKGKTADIPVSVKNPKVTSIEISAAPSKTTYTEGETFSPSGMVVIAKYENGLGKETTDFSYSPNRELETTDKEMIISYTGDNAQEGIITVSQPITVNKASGGGSASSDKISVYFTLLGDDKHGKPNGASDTHTKKNENLKTWIPKTKITLNKESYVIDALEKALSLNGIPYTNQGNYISEIKGLSEFDNGNLSGWMYTLNGKYPTNGVSEQKLSNGDVIIFHYTDDYTVEKTNFSGGSSSSNKRTGIKKDNSKADNNKDVDDTNKDVGDDNTQNGQEYINPFGDVKSDDWFSSAIEFVHKKNLMKGVSDNEFAPNENLSRAMIVTAIYRMENEPSASFNKFGDVNADEWYSAAVAWASENGIVNGVSENEFAPNDNLTREQMAAIIYRYIMFKGGDTSVGENADINSYADAENISDYAVEAIRYAVASGLMKGDSETTLNPSGTATRAETATIIMRLFGIME